MLVRLPVFWLSCFNNCRIHGECLASKIHLSPSHPVTSAAVRFRAVVLMLFIHFLLLLPLWGFRVRFLFCYAIHSVLFSFARVLIALPMSSRCHMAAIVLCLFLKVTRVGMQYVCVWHFLVMLTDVFTLYLVTWPEGSLLVTRITCIWLVNGIVMMREVSDVVSVITIN